jgi:hypothetical protein
VHSARERPFHSTRHQEVSHCRSSIWCSLGLTGRSSMTSSRRQSSDRLHYRAAIGAYPLITTITFFGEQLDIFNPEMAVPTANGGPVPGGSHGCLTPSARTGWFSISAGTAVTAAGLPTTEPRDPHKGWSPAMKDGPARTAAYRRTSTPTTSPQPLSCARPSPSRRSRSSTASPRMCPGRTRSPEGTQWPEPRCRW